MRVRIEGHHLPGRVYDGRGDVQVGVQLGGEPFEPVPGDATEAAWIFDVRVVETETGPDWRGPAVHGRRGERFLYLTWGDVSGGGWEMFRRAKLMVADVDPGLVARAAASPAATLVARVHLTDECGAPRCARVAPPAITWAVD